MLDKEILFKAIEQLKALTAPSQEVDELIEELGLAPDNAAKAPNYTSSIDAALTLLPEGSDYIIGYVNGHIGGTPYAQVGDVTVYAETPCISLCIAALTLHFDDEEK